jgi:pilus assembly protein Flp/PilA
MLQSFLKDDEGQGLVEYALLLALIAIVAIGAITTVGEKVEATFTFIGKQLKAK